MGLPGSTWVYLGLPGSTWVHLGLLGSTWVYLGLVLSGLFKDNLVEVGSATWNCSEHSKLSPDGMGWDGMGCIQDRYSA